jgi:hypothetical protein
LIAEIITIANLTSVLIEALEDFLSKMEGSETKKK